MWPNEISDMWAKRTKRLFYIINCAVSPRIEIGFGNWSVAEEFLAFLSHYKESMSALLFSQAWWDFLCGLCSFCHA
jgi:hypothetical protein